MKNSNFEKNSQSLLFLGHNELGHEIWLGKDQITKHMFIAGSTGSGKTELLLNIASNSLSWGSGALIVDGKGDITFFSKLHAIAHALDRDDDLMLLNFSMSNVKEGVVSHTINPFARLSSDELCQIMGGLISPVSTRDSMWRERAVALLNIIIKTLVWKRDIKKVPMTVSKIEELLDLDRLASTYDEISADVQIDHTVLRELKIYLETLPGFSFEKDKQLTTTREQHGYLTMQLTRPLNLLSSSYGHILNDEHADIDINDVVLNRRTLFVMLPSLEKSSSEIENIGRLIVSLIKSMMAQVFKTPVEGGWNSVVKKRMTNAETPYLIILDEVGQYITDGMDTMAQQARSLNFGLIFSTQDFDSLQNSAPKLTQAILSNTNTKILMKAEYPNSHVMRQIHGLFSDEESKIIVNFQMKRSANRTAILDLLQFNHPTPLKREELAELLHKHNKEVSERMSEVSTFSLALMLKDFSPGDMLVIYGTDVIKGRAGYVELQEDEIEHQIKLEKFAHIENYGPKYSDQKANAFVLQVLRDARNWLKGCDKKQISEPWLNRYGFHHDVLNLANLLYIKTDKPNSLKVPVETIHVFHEYRFEGIFSKFIEEAAFGTQHDFSILKKKIVFPIRKLDLTEPGETNGSVDLLDNIIISTASIKSDDEFAFGWDDGEATS